MGKGHYAAVAWSSCLFPIIVVIICLLCNKEGGGGLVLGGCCIFFFLVGWGDLFVGCLGSRNKELDELLVSGKKKSLRLA